MRAEKPKARVWEFGPFRLDESERLLEREGTPVALTPKVFDTLVALVERSGHLVDKDELVEKLWPDTFVEPGTLTRNVSDLRKALGGDDYIETVPKRGYRFVAKVTQVTGGMPYAGSGAAEAQSVLEEPGAAAPQPANESPPAAAEAGAPVPASPATRPRAKRAALWLGTVAAGVAILMLASRKERAGRAPPAPAIRSIAILPFKPLTPERGDEYLGLGITDTLITKLSSVRKIIVRPTSAVQKYSAGGFDPMTVGREQEVEAVLEGSVQKLGDKVRLTVRLLETKSGAPLWAYQCDQFCADIFALQDTISEEVATALLARLTGEERRLLERRETTSAEAYQLYLKGRHFWNRRNADGLERSLEYFEQAIAQDPRYARAYAGLSDSYLLLWGYGFRASEGTIPKVKETARKALELDPTLAEAHLSLGAVAWNWDWNWKEAERELRRALEMNPNYATAHHYLGEFLAYQGRFEEGWAEIRRALEIDPTSPIINTDAGLVLEYWRRWDDAIEQYRRALELDPGFHKARRFLCAGYARKGMFEKAQAELVKFREIDDSPGKRESLLLAGDVHIFEDRKAEARKAYAEALAARGYMDPGTLMWMHILLGEKDQAFEWMEKAFAARSTFLTSLKINPGFDPLRSDPRFESFLTRMNLSR